jgi:hypothetical protein
MDHYCAGFVYSSGSNRCTRTMLTFLALNKKALAHQDQRLVESIREFPFRLLRISDIMDDKVPVIVGEINDPYVSSTTRADFFESVHNIFSTGGSLPSIYSISVKEVQFLFITLTILT